MPDPAVARLEQAAEKARAVAPRAGWWGTKTLRATFGFSQEDADHIAAASPDTVLRLCARVRELETAGTKALEVAEAQGLTDATYWVRDLRAALVVSRPDTEPPTVVVSREWQDGPPIRTGGDVVSRPGEDTNHA